MESLAFRYLLSQRMAARQRGLVMRKEQVAEALQFTRSKSLRVQEVHGGGDIVTPSHTSSHSESYGSDLHIACRVWMRKWRSSNLKHCHKSGSEAGCQETWKYDGFYSFYWNYADGFFNYFKGGDKGNYGSVAPSELTAGSASGTYDCYVKEPQGEVS